MKKSWKPEQKSTLPEVRGNAGNKGKFWTTNWAHFGSNRIHCAKLRVDSLLTTFLGGVRLGKEFVVVNTFLLTINILGGKSKYSVVRFDMPEIRETRSPKSAHFGSDRLHCAK